MEDSFHYTFCGEIPRNLVVLGFANFIIYHCNHRCPRRQCLAPHRARGPANRRGQADLRGDGRAATKCKYLAVPGPADKRLTGNGGKLNTSQAELQCVQKLLTIVFIWFSQL